MQQIISHNNIKDIKKSHITSSYIIYSYTILGYDHGSDQHGTYDVGWVEPPILQIKSQITCMYIFTRMPLNTKSTRPYNLLTTYNLYLNKVILEFF